MQHIFQGSTLALQHYYDISTVAHKHPLLTAYHAKEQPFGREMAVWMAEYGEEIPVHPDTKRRLDEAMLKNRAVTDAHMLRVLDFGATEGRSFVVTDDVPPESMTLRTHLNVYGPLEPWQALRLLEQLVSVVICAHKAGFRDLCLSSNDIFITQADRLEIAVGPMGIGLHRLDVLEISDIPITPALIRHIPPWEYTGNTSNIIEHTPSQEHPQNKDDQEPPENSGNEGDESKPETQPEKEPGTESNKEISEDKAASEVKEDAENNSENSSNPEPDADDSENKEISEDKEAATDSIQDLSQAEIEARPSICMPPEDVCSDVYDLAAILYESLCGSHPFFGTDDLCDAAMNLVQGKPTDLSMRLDISEDLSQTVMDVLNHPKQDGEKAFLTAFLAACTTEDREKARAAEKDYLPSPIAQVPRKRRKLRPSNLVHPISAIVVLLIVGIFVAGLLIYPWAKGNKPTDLFSIPELVPIAAGNGVDVVIAPRVIPPNTSAYITSTDGTLMRLGVPPIIYRQQAAGTKLVFVLADESGHSLQVPVTVNGHGGLMVVPVELNW